MATKDKYIRLIMSLFVCGLSVCGLLSCKSDDKDGHDKEQEIVTMTEAKDVFLENVTLYRKQGVSDGITATHNYYIDYKGKEMRIYNPYMLNLDLMFGSELESETRVNATGDVVVMTARNISMSSSAERLFKIRFVERVK